MESDNDLSLLNYVDLMVELRQCKLCDKELPCGARPIVQVSESAKLLIVGQAPGIRVHETGIPLPHPSPRNNRWLKQNSWFEAELVPCLKERVVGLKFSSS